MIDKPDGQKSFDNLNGAAIKGIGGLYFIISLISAAYIGYKSLGIDYFVWVAAGIFLQGLVVNAVCSALGNIINHQKAMFDFLKNQNSKEKPD